MLHQRFSHNLPQLPWIWHCKKPVIEYDIHVAKTCQIGSKLVVDVEMWSNAKGLSVFATLKSTAFVIVNGIYEPWQGKIQVLHEETKKLGKLTKSKQVFLLQCSFDILPTICPSGVQASILVGEKLASIVSETTLVISRMASNEDDRYTINTFPILITV